MTTTNFMRVLYLRDQNTIQPKATGGFTRGAPLACLITRLDRELDTIRFSYSITHPKDKFDRKLALKIAKARMEDGPAFAIQGIPGNGHDITKKVLVYIVQNTEFLADTHHIDRKDLARASQWRISTRFHKLASEWLARHATVKANKNVQPMEEDHTIYGWTVEIGTDERFPEHTAIGLCKFNKDKAWSYCRFDIGKMAFIDTLPFHATETDLATLRKWIVQSVGTYEYRAPSTKSKDANSLVLAVIQEAPEKRLCVPDIVDKLRYQGKTETETRAAIQRLMEFGHIGFDRGMKCYVEKKSN